MRKLRVVNINPASAFRVGLGIGAVIGIIVAVVYILVSFIGGVAVKGILHGIGGGILGIFIGIFIGTLYMLGTGFVCLLYAVIYNASSKYLGPLEIEVDGE